MTARKNREDMVIATKFTSTYGKSDIKVNYTGNSTKSLRVSLEASLRKLQTSYVDILYVHWWDYTTSIPELCQSLNQVVLEGKALYLAVSDTPAWVVSKFNQYARDHGMRQFSLYQGRWSAAERDFERDIIPMCLDEGMGIAPWGALGGGAFKTQEHRQAMEKEGDKGRSMGPPSPERAAAIAAVVPVLDKIAKEIGYSITSVALAYVMKKAPYVFPIVGGRKISHLKDNIKALEIVLTDAQIQAIDGAVPFDMGFPHTFLGGTSPETIKLLQRAANYAFVDGPKAITYKN